MSLSLGEIDSDDENDWSNDIWVAHLQCEALVPFYELQVKLIIECTDLEPLTWIQLYAQRFRDIVDQEPTLTASQIKRMLYTFESNYK